MTEGVIERAGEMPGSRGDSGKVWEGRTKRGSPGLECSLWNNTWHMALLCAWIAGITNQRFNQGDEHSAR